MPSDSFKLTGTIEKILTPRDAGQKQFQTVVVNTGGQYPQMVPVEFPEKCFKYIEELREGEPISCDFSLRGREYNGRYYVNLSGFKINSEGQPHQRGTSSSGRQPERQQREYRLEDRAPNGGREPISDRERRYQDNSDDSIPF